MLNNEEKSAQEGLSQIRRCVLYYSDWLEFCVQRKAAKINRCPVEAKTDVYCEKLKRM
jgi:hypothetical protein